MTTLVAPMLFVGVRTLVGVFRRLHTPRARHRLVFVLPTLGQRSSLQMSTWPNSPTTCFSLDALVVGRGLRPARLYAASQRMSLAFVGKHLTKKREFCTRVRCIALLWILYMAFSPVSAGIFCQSCTSRTLAWPP